MKPKTLNILKEILFILIWWYLAARVFFVFRYSSIALIAEPDKEGQLFFTMVRLNNYIAVIGGGITAFIELYLSPRVFNLSLYWKKFLVKFFIYFLLATLLASFAYLFMQSIDFNAGRALFDPEMNPRLIFNFITFIMFMVFTVLSLNIARDVKSVVGNRILRARLLGKYYQPKEEERIFMFLDLESSTAIAETLGHIKYSKLIQDCFKDVSDAIINNKARVYQYVGDEVVLTWNVKKKNAIKNSIQCFFDFMDTLRFKESYYVKTYGFLPVFRAALNVGKVTVAEVGVVKKEISYHGDVLNTASRIQKLCKENDSLLLCSGVFVSYADETLGYEISLIENAKLRGKKGEVAVFSINQN